jgi:peptidoglycan/LPS O-acetylase OafA/YrhL
MFDEERLRSMSARERMQLMCTLAAMDPPGLPPARGGERRRRIALIVIVICCLALAAWIGLLAATLPRYYRTGGWRGAWVGFDLGLLGAFIATGWASWRRRQVLIVCLIVLATLLCCDAWFDVVLDARTPGFWLSLASALVIELPLAGIAILGARRLLRMTSGTLLRAQGDVGSLPRLRDLRLVGTGGGRPLHDLLTMTTDEELDA